MSFRALFHDQMREAFELADGIFDLAHSANAKNYELVVITNQAGIGHGYHSEDQVHLH